MRTLITAQQHTFFTQNGYIEFEGIQFDPSTLFSSIHSIIEKRGEKSLSRLPIADQYRLGRDLWRDDASLQTHLLKTTGPIASKLTGKSLKLALDQWIPAGSFGTTSSSMKELFCIQGLAIGAIFRSSDTPLPPLPTLGLAPLPKNPHHVLFVKPDLLIHWQSLANSPNTDLYLAFYAFQSAVYIHNPKDPAGNDLKKLGLHFGDSLRNATHPSIPPP